MNFRKATETVRTAAEAGDMDWSVPDDVWNEDKRLGLAAQVSALQTHWVLLLQEHPTEQLLAMYKQVTNDFYDARYDSRYLGSSGDTVTWVDRKRLAVVIALGSKLTEEIDRPASEEFDSPLRRGGTSHSGRQNMIHTKAVNSRKDQWFTDKKARQAEKTPGWTRLKIWMSPSHRKE